MGVGIEVRGLNAWYGKNQSLKSIDMTVPANHVTAVIGPSGCGKSTFVRCLNRMHETIPEARAEGSVKSARWMSMAAGRIRLKYAAVSAWYFRSRTRFPRCRFMTTLPPD